RPHHSGQRIYQQGRLQRRGARLRRGDPTQSQECRCTLQPGNIFFRLGRYDEAIKNYDKAIELKPDYAIAFNNRCFAYYAKGEHDQAIRDCDHAIRLDSKQANFFVSRGNVLRKKHDYDQAMADYNEAIRLDPDNVNAYLGRCTVFVDKADYG